MSLLGAIVKSIVKNIGNFASGLVGVPIAGNIVVNAWDYWQKESDEKQRKMELEAYARQAIQEILPRALAAVREEGASLPPPAQQVLVDYLCQVPASIRRSLRRPADHTGTTVPPGRAVRSAGDLLPFLPPKLPRFKPGDQPLANSDLQLVELLGQGGFGEVWKAVHLDRPKLPPVALKFCLDSAAGHSLERERDLLDHVASAGKHAGIVQLLYTHFRANPPCLEYEYVEGGDLTGVFAELHGAGAPGPEGVARVVLALARIVAFAHGQNPAIVHRDLKPANILVRRRDGKLAFKIADFGIGGLAAKEKLHKLQTGQTKPSERQLDTLLGAYTPLYASPEQMDSALPDPRDDVHALGIIWFQLQTGRLALMSLPSDWRDDLVDAKVPGPLVDLLALCIGRLARRPADAGDLAKRLQALLEPDKESESKEPKKREGPKRSVVVTPMKPDQFFTNSLGMKFAPVPAGTFWMGGEGGNAGERQVEIARAFYLGVYPVTQGQWQALMGNNPSHFSRGGGGKDLVKRFSEADLKQFPVESVSWEEAQQFIDKLNEEEKESGWMYCLPAEAEWEYACRRGPTSKEECGFDFYLDRPTNDLSSNQANFDGNHPGGNAPKGPYLQRTTKVGSYKPNRLGLCDMHGNVWEWCEDAGASPRVIRGGSWYFDAEDCRAAFRIMLPPDSRVDDLGFRLARVSSGSK